MDNYNRFRMDATTGYTQEALDQMNTMFSMRVAGEDLDPICDSDDIKNISEQVEKDFRKNGIPCIGKVYNAKSERGLYFINHHDGKSIHKDGSPFFDMMIFHNRKRYSKAIRELEAQGYTRQQYVV